MSTNARGHQLCVAHLLRDLNYLIELEKTQWAKDMRQLFLKSLELKSFFTTKKSLLIIMVQRGQTLTRPFSLRTDDKPLEIMASIDLLTMYKTIDNQDVALTDRMGEQWMVLAWVDPDKEPTKHTVQDLASLKEELDALNLPFTFIIPESKFTDSFRNTDYSSLPQNHQFLVVGKMKLLQSLSNQLNRELANQLPVFVICNA